MAQDFRVRFGFFDHPKTVKLARRGGHEAVVCFLRLWEFCGATPERGGGDLTGLDDEDIEIAARWTGAPGLLVESLEAVGFLDGVELGRSVHDFTQHNPFVAESNSRSEQSQRAAHERWHVRRGEIKEGCALCAELTTAKTDTSPEPLGNAEIVPGSAEHMPGNAGHGLALMPGNAPSLQPTNQPTDEGELTQAEIEARCFDRCGALAGEGLQWIRKAQPITSAELEDALRGKGRSHKYIAKEIISSREAAREAGSYKPPPGGGRRAPKRTFIDSMAELARDAAGGSDV
jgi:hypothetical protein